MAARFSPLSIGTQTGGSTVYPASLSGLYGMTLSQELVPLDGVLRLSRSFDMIGLMARTSRDMADLVEVLTESAGGFGVAVQQASLGAMKIGVVRSGWGYGGPQATKDEKWESDKIVSI